VSSLSARLLVVGVVYLSLSLLPTLLLLGAVEVEVKEQEVVDQAVD
jgi:hypothetical protein